MLRRMPYDGAHTGHKTPIILKSAFDARPFSVHRFLRYAFRRPRGNRDNNTARLRIGGRNTAPGKSSNTSHRCTSTRSHRTARTGWWLALRLPFRRSFDAANYIVGHSTSGHKWLARTVSQDMAESLRITVNLRSFTAPESCGSSASLSKLNAERVWLFRIDA